MYMKDTSLTAGPDESASACEVGTLLADAAGSADACTQACMHRRVWAHPGERVYAGRSVCVCVRRDKQSFHRDTTNTFWKLAR